MIFSQDANGLVVMDAEHGVLAAGDAFYWQEIADTNASNGVALKPTGQALDKTLCGTIDFTFKVTTAGNYNLFFRLLTRGRQGKIWVEVDGQKNAVGPHGNNGRVVFCYTGLQLAKRLR